MAAELSGSDLSKLLKDAATLLPVKIVLTGGEPLLRPDIEHVLHALSDATSETAVRRCLNTNGDLLDGALLSRIGGLVDEIRVSIDGIADINDKLRGSGNFERAVAAAKLCRDARVGCKILVTVTRTSLSDLPRLINFLFAQGLQNVSLHPFKPIGRGAARADLTVTLQEIAQVLENGAHGASARTAALSTTEQSHCGVGWYLNVYPDGRVYPCHVLTKEPFLLGNVRERSLSEMWQSARLRQLRELDFRQMAAADEALAGLKCRGTCMGSVYGAAPNSRAWPEAFRRAPRRDQEM